MEDTTIENTLQTVETLYAKKDFSEALKVLEAHRSEIPSGVWNYNMGTIYSGMGEFARARFHFLQAENDGLMSKEVSQNLELVESNLETARLEKPLGVSDYLIKGSLIASEGIITTLALIILVVGLVNLRKSKNLKQIGALGVFVLFLMGVNWWIKSWPKMVVTSPQVIHEGPSAIFEAKDELPPGVLLVTSKEGEWVRIRYPSRFEGWIKNNGLKEIK